MDPPELTIVGGPNGSGKSTFAIRHADKHGISYLGADSIASELSPDDPFSARIPASRLFIDRIHSALHMRQSFVVETTLAGRSFRHFVRKAKESGFQITIVFVFLDSADTCVKRIGQRVRLGGHHVPEADVRRRFKRSMVNFWNTYRVLADSWLLVYNSSDSPENVAIGNRDTTIVKIEPLFRIFKSVLDNA